MLTVAQRHQRSLKPSLKKMSPVPNDMEGSSAALSPPSKILDATGLEGGARHGLVDSGESYDVRTRLLSGEWSEGDNGLLDPVTRVSEEASTSNGVFLSRGRPSSRRQGSFTLSLTMMMAPGVPAHL